MPDHHTSLLTFIHQFEAAWRNPIPQKFAALLHPDVVLFQPHRPPIYGKDNAEQEFQNILKWLPTLSGEVERYGEQHESRSNETEMGVFIELRLDIPTKYGVVAFRTLDVIRLEEGKIIERTAYFDTLHLAKLLLSHPSLWIGGVKYLCG